uniref:Uncharacterized protein n=1 Tax=Falco tinnunculus TaxID=100819 RepID=A0A8C4XIP0_FALTI
AMWADGHAELRVRFIITYHWLHQTSVHSPGAFTRLCLGPLPFTTASACNGLWQPSTSEKTGIHQTHPLNQILLLRAGGLWLMGQKSTWRTWALQEVNPKSLTRAASSSLFIRTMVLKSLLLLPLGQTPYPI